MWWTAHEVLDRYWVRKKINLIHVMDERGQTASDEIKTNRKHQNINAKRKKRMRESKVKEISIHHRVITGTAKKLPTTTQLIKKAIIADLTTISH